jgi:thiamine-monophosphate kinase
VLQPNPTTAPLGGEVWREDSALQRIAALITRARDGSSAVRIGDDAAVLARPAGRLVCCTDAGVDGVHLDSTRFPLGDLGYRTAIAALSDLAAMGAAPLGVLVALCARGDVDVVALETEVVAACATAGCPVVGGDLSTSQTTTVVVAALGVETEGRTVGRHGASPGDAVLVTGPLGGAAAGRRCRAAGAPLDDVLVQRFRRPEVRLAHGALAARHGATAMLDVSDGLARDLRRLADASEVGVELDDVPVFDGATLEEALGGGDDYELVCTHPDPVRLGEAFRAAGLAIPIRIGEIVADASVRRLAGNALPDVGWRHGDS